jgi:thiosulfate reductase cytochrome b subunit
MLKSKPIHPWPLRVMHWLNALAIVMMIGSGWQIYNASPLFNFSFPPLLTIGQWLGAGIAWHLAFMWLLVALVPKVLPPMVFGGKVDELGS